MHKDTRKALKALGRYIESRGREICRDNECQPEDDLHNCESYAYITSDYKLLDICASDFFQGHGEPVAGVLLPWDGSLELLKEEIDEQIFSVLVDPEDLEPEPEPWENNEVLNYNHII